MRISFKRHFIGLSVRWVYDFFKNTTNDLKEFVDSFFIKLDKQKLLKNTTNDLKEFDVSFFIKFDKRKLLKNRKDKLNKIYNKDVN